MKNIILIGASRAGKTTFARMLNKKYNYQIIDGDATRQAYKEAIMKDSNVTNDNFGKTEEYQKFIITLFRKYAKYNKDLSYVLDTVDILPEHAYKFDNKTIILVFGYPKANAKEILEIQRQKQTADWTDKVSDDELLNLIYYWTEKSKEYEKECEKLNIKFVDTSFNRQEVLDRLLKWVKENS